MATDNGMNAYLDAAFHGAKPVGGPAPQVHLNRAVLERGKAAMGGGELGSARAPGGAARAGGSGRGGVESAFDRNGDPAVTGDFERKGYPGTGLISNFLYGAGQLTDAGKRQQADKAILDKGIALYSQARAAGASDTQAAQHAVATLGAPLLMGLMMHPSAPLASSSAMHRFLSGDSGARFAPDLKSGQQFQIDPQTGEVLGSKPIPGVAQPNPNFRPTGKTITDAQGRVQALGTDAQGNLVYQPVMPAGAGGIPTLGQPAGGGASGAPGALTVAPKGTGKPLTQTQEAEVQSLTQVAGALDKAKTNLSAQVAAGGTNIGRGLSNIWSPLGSSTSSNYASAIDSLRATIQGAVGSGSSRLKAAFENQQNLIPSGFDSEPKARTDFSNLSNIVRTNIATMAREHPTDPALQNLATQQNATPDYWLGGTDANGNRVLGMAQKLQLLETNPGALSNNDIAQIYAHEAFDAGYGARLSSNGMASLGDQMNGRNLWALRDTILAQDPSAAGQLPDHSAFNLKYGPQVDQWHTQIGARGVYKGPPATVQNPQGTQTPQPGNRYLPAEQDAARAQRADATQAQVQQAQAQAASFQQPQIAAPETNNPQAQQPTQPQAARAASGPGFSLTTPAEAAEMSQAAAQQPAAAMAAPSAATGQAKAPGMQGAPNAALPPATYRPTSQADALNYNQLQSILQQEGKPFSGPVQWQGNAQGGSAAIPGHPSNPGPMRSSPNLDFGGGADNYFPNVSAGGDRQNPGTGFPNGQPDRAGFQSPNQMVQQALFGSGGGGEDQVGRMDPISLLRRVFGGGGGQQAQPQGGQGDEQVTLPDVNVTAPSPASQQQVIPVPPPQPRNASSLWSPQPSSGNGPSIDTLENAFGGLVGGE